MNDFKKYLPSKKFITVILFFVFLTGLSLGLFFGIKGIISLVKNNKNTKNGKQVEVTVGEIIQKDGNANGIPDWEEYLWGLDPDKNGPENKAFILTKKNILLENGDLLPYDNTKTILENEALSREFFATIVSLQQTGNLNEESLKSISDTIGQKIEATPISNIYTMEMLNLKTDSDNADANYSNAFSDLLVKYENEDIGSELTLISQGLGNNDEQALFAATTVASAYRNFGQELTKMPVPSSISSIHLSLANNYEKTAQSIEGLTKMLLDPILGMKSILNYKRYSDALVSDIEKLSNILQESAI
jgi:hypothetical protein